MALAAETPEDLEAVRQLWAEKETLAGSGGSPSKWCVETLGDVAEFLGVEQATVRDWRTGPTPMPGESGKYNLKEIVAWRCERLKQSGGTQKPREVIELELREKQIDVAKKELALKKSRNELVSRKAAKAAQFAINNEVRCRLESMTGQVTSGLDPSTQAHVKNELDQQIKLILTAMSQKAEG